MTQTELNDLLVQVVAQARAVKIPVSRSICPEVSINRRAVTRFGCCVRKNGTYTIELSAHLLDAEEQAVRQTLAHEVLHTCLGCSNHGPRWKEYAARMNAAYGYQISRTDSFEKLGLPEPVQEVRYLLVCTQCGAEFARTRRSPLVEHPERYRCRCGGRLERKQ